MKLFEKYDLRSVIANQMRTYSEEIDKISNEEILANDLELLAENIFIKYYIEPLEIQSEDVSRREIKQGKINRYVDPFFADSEDGNYVALDGVVGTFYYPFKGDKTLFSCRASTYSLSGYPDIEVYDHEIAISIERTLREMQEKDATDKLLESVEKQIQAIKKGAEYVNKDIAVFNRTLKFKALELLEAKKNKVESFFAIAKALEVPIEKKDYVEKVIPIERKTFPVSHRYDSEDYYLIKESDYNEILGIIKHTASTYERTPSSYRFMQEEDLRNTLLAALNGIYKGDATGETFRNNGKTDICIERENRAAFVAECKMWNGPSAIKKAIDQLDGYLTWRDCKTALIFFVRRKGFMSIVDAAHNAIEKDPRVQQVKELDRNEFECLVVSDEKPGRKVKMRIMLFDINC